MYGISIAFKDFNIMSGFIGGDFVGLKYFSQFLTDPKLPLVLKNTIMINLLGLVIGFPAPVILAILITELRGDGSVNWRRPYLIFPTFCPGSFSEESCWNCWHPGAL